MATRVLVWLDNKDFEPLEVTRLLNILERINIVSKVLPHYQPSWEGGGLNIGDRKMWMALHRLLSHQYWQRAWILQEIAMGKVVHIRYGKNYIAWNYLAEMVASLASGSGYALASPELGRLDIGF
jgi:hypothetical protein